MPSAGGVISPEKGPCREQQGRWTLARKSGDPLGGIDESKSPRRVYDQKWTIDGEVHILRLAPLVSSSQFPVSEDKHMAVVLSIDWDGITPEQYDKATAALNLIADRPKGLRMHVASFDDSGAHITDIWDSSEDFQAFAANRL